MAADACREVAISEEVYFDLCRIAIEGVSGRAAAQGAARVLAALVTGLDPSEPTALDVGELAAACVADRSLAYQVVTQLARHGLLRRGPRGYDRATGRERPSWQLSPGIFAVAGRTTRTITTTYYPDRGKVEFHAVRQAA